MRLSVLGPGTSLCALAGSVVLGACFSSSSAPPGQDAGGFGEDAAGSAPPPVPDATVDQVSPPGSDAADAASVDGPSETSAGDDAEDAPATTATTSDAPLDQGVADAATDTGVTCGPIYCGTMSGPDGGTYDSSCSSTCSNFTPSCSCSEDAPETCYCAIGNPSPSCLTGGLSECGYVPSCSNDLMTDALNCGRCGHSCQGLPCTGGICTPPQLSFGGPYSVSDWTSDGTYIYATDCGGPQTVIRIPVGGVPTSGSPLVYSTGSGPWGIAVDSTTVYWLQDSGGTVWSAPIGGGTPTQLGTYAQSWFSACGGPHSIAMDATNLYWAVQPSAGFGYVFSVAKTGGQVHILAHDSEVLRGTVEVDANYVYFLSDNLGSTGQLRSVPKTSVGDAGTPTTILASFTNDQVLDMRMTASAFYFVGFGTNMWTVPIAGGTPTVFWPYRTNMSAQHLETDGTTLFFTDFVNSNVYALPLAGGTAPRVAVGQVEPDRILIDANAIYWTSNYGGYYRIPKTYLP